MNSTSVDAPIYGRLKKYWRKTRYQRLYPDYGKGNAYDDDAVLLSKTRKKRYSNVARFGGADDEQPRRKNGRTWSRMRKMPKLRLKRLLVTPVMRILARIKEGYVNMMLGVAGNAGTLSGTGNGVFGSKRIPKARQVKEKKKRSKKVSSKDEFETKFAYEIYKVMVASRQLEQQSANHREVLSVS